MSPGIHLQNLNDQEEKKVHEEKSATGVEFSSETNILCNERTGYSKFSNSTIALYSQVFEVTSYCAFKNQWSHFSSVSRIVL